MTTLGTENDLFRKFQSVRSDIVACQSIADIAKVRKDLEPYIAVPPEEGGLKLDLRKVLANCFKIKEAELYGEAPPQTDINTKDIPKDMMPDKKETAPTQSQTTGAEEVTLPPAKLEGRAKEIAEEMKPIDAENFKTPIQPPFYGAEALNPTPAPIVSTETPAPAEKKSRSRSKHTEESSIEYIPRTEKSVKIFRRINTGINGVAYTNNEIGYEVIAGTREEALEEAKALREASLADIRELNELMKVKPVTQTTPPPAPVTNTPATVAQPTVTAKDAQEVFGGFDLDKVMKAVAAKNPAGLEEGHEFDRYNLERLRALFALIRSTDDVSVQNPDGSGMMLGAYITQETQKFGAQFPMAK